MIIKLNLEQAKRAIVLCFAANQPVAIWGPVGIGKSSVLAQIAAELGWRMFDVRLSDKEPSDLGGIPVPDQKLGKVRFMMPEIMPFDTDEKAIVFLDEFDRSALEVQNVALQIILDRQVNGHKLSSKARVVMAGNGSTDIGTSPLTKAAASRMVHLYIESESEGALESYLKWAEKNNISPVLRSFARYRKDVWCGNGKSEDNEVEELAVPTKRTFDMADRIMRAAAAVDFPTKDILRALVAGCVGSAAATELIAWKELCEKAPTIEEVLKAPDTCKLPTDLGVYYALTMTLSDYASGDKVPAKDVEKIATYGARWSEEQAAYLFKRLLDKVPALAATKVYQTWNRKREA